MSEQNRLGLQFKNQADRRPSRLDLPLLVYRRDKGSFAPHNEICPYCQGLGVVDPDEARKKIAAVKPQARPRKRRPKHLSNAPALPVGPESLASAERDRASLQREEPE
jgi:hypothetical protein